MKYMATTNVATGTTTDPTTGAVTTNFTPNDGTVTPTSTTPISPLPPPGTPATISDVTPPPVQPNTPIQTSTLTNTPTLNLPPQQTPSTVGPANAAIGASASVFTPSQASLLSSSDAAEKSAQTNYNGTQGDVTGLINQYLGEGTDEEAQMNAAGTPGLLSTSNNLTAQYNAQNAAYTAQYNAIMSGSGTLDQKEGQIQDLQAQHGTQLASIAAQQTIAQADYNNAMNIIQQQIAIKYGPIKDSITYLQSILDNNKDILTEQQQNQFNANLAVQNQQYTQGTFYDQLNATTGIQMVQDAAKQGADPATLQAMGEIVSNGGSLADVAGASNGYLGNSTYTIAFNQNTGQMEPFNTTTGKWGSGASGTPTTTIDPANPDSLNTVTGSDGSSYNFNASGYNTADPNYALKLNQNVQNIQSQFGAITSAPQAQAVLDKLAPTSTLTGAMVISAAQGAGIDPTVLLGQLQNESLCGSSNVAKSDNNCGGISYAGQQDATQGTPRPASEGGYYAKFDTVQDGLNAQAALIAKAKQTPTATTTGQTQTTQFNLQKITTLKTALPPNIGNAVGFLTQTGDGYIDMSKVTDQPGSPAGYSQEQAEEYAQQYGLAVLTGTQAGAMQDADTALTQINNIQAAWNAVAPKSGLGAYLGAFPNQVSAAFHIGNASALKAYIGLVPTAVSTLNAITGSKRLSQFSESVSQDALPSLTGYVTNGQADTLAEGNAKLDDLRKDINASITPIIPTSTGAPLSGEQSVNPSATSFTYNNTSYIQGADGLYYSQS